ncbi:hypothetical protein SAMN04488058_101204 [Deinococcus reticulitermitis]|uniref:Uncharacterized protein n=1 Tax=Deinococcus reticulitermitis TaxID=856736 RepID=A0A1H6SK08_9DEIO|nr:hypothetical protein SAMN04488058_101204 [Deinococcus reticulitermitis]
MFTAPSFLLPASGSRPAWPRFQAGSSRHRPEVPSTPSRSARSALLRRCDPSTLVSAQLLEHLARRSQVIGRAVQGPWHSQEDEHFIVSALHVPAQLSPPDLVYLSGQATAHPVMGPTVPVPLTGNDQSRPPAVVALSRRPCRRETPRLLPALHRLPPQSAHRAAHVARWARLNSQTASWLNVRPADACAYWPRRMSKLSPPCRPRARGTGPSGAP